MLRMTNAFVSDSTGAAAVEYAVLVAGIFLAIAVVVSDVGTAVHAMYDSVAGALGF